jgi:thymidylate kinase
MRSECGNGKNNVLIVFVGAQAVGKTTQARLLFSKLRKMGYSRAHMTDLVHYTLLHLNFQEFLRQLCKSRKIMDRFYEGEEPRETVDPQVYKKLFVLMEGLHIFGYLISIFKLKMLMIRKKILIEYDGYIFKQLADLWFLANELKVTDAEGYALRFLRKITAFLLLSAFKLDTLVVVFCEADYETIKSRCLVRGCLIEPEKYVTFQYVLYNKIIKIIPKMTKSSVKVLRVNSNRSIMDVHSEIVSTLLQYFRYMSTRSIVKR